MTGLQVWVDVEGHDPRALLITRTQTMSLLVADLLKGVPDEVRDAGKAQEVRWFSTRSSQSWGIECSPSDRNTLEQHKISHHAVFRIGIQVRSDASDEESNKPPHRDLSPQTSPIVAETDSTMSGTADGWDDVRHCLVVESDKLHILPGGGTGPCIEEGRGLQGLVNLGNTCFMNSALQCLSNSRLLTEYFFSGSWRKELNTSNPLGMRGELAETYAGLLTRLWGQQASYAEDPSDLKRVIGCFAPQFTGYSQHDSQELLAFLLDGLHEDLNRIYNKPPTEVPSGDGTNDETIAAVAWERHRLRNDSVVQDLFAGQYRSKLQCSCSNVSVTFDPYNCVTLQLPQAHLAAVPLTFHPTHPLARPVKYVLRLSRYATMADLKVEVERLTETPAASLVVAEIFSCKFYHTFSDSEKVSLDGDTHVYAVSLPHGVEEVFCRVFGRPSAILCRDRARDRPKPDEPLASTVFLKVGCSLILLVFLPCTNYFLTFFYNLALVTIFHVSIATRSLTKMRHFLCSSFTGSSGYRMPIMADRLDLLPSERPDSLFCMAKPRHIASSALPLSRQSVVLSTRRQVSFFFASSKFDVALSCPWKAALQVP